MNNKFVNLFKDILLDVAVLIIILLGAGNIMHSLPLRFRIRGGGYCFFSPQMISLHRSMSAIIGFVLIFVSYWLFKRVRIAWIITLCLMTLSIFLHVLCYNGHINFVIFVELLVIIILALMHKDFSRATNPISLKLGIALAFVSIFLVLLNTTIGLLMLRPHFGDIHSFIDAFIDSCQLLFFMDISYIEPKTKVAVLFGNSEIILNWASILAALFFIVKPLIYQPIVSKIDREKIRKLLRLYSNNPISYLTVEDDKKYFWGSQVEGAIAYVIAGTVAVCAGDPICRQEDTILLLSEFIQFCKQNNHDICFCQVMPQTLRYFNDMGFGVTKYGEEAMFDLEKYELSGGKGLKIRNAVHHANKLGITVHEYKPLQHRDKYIEEQIREVSREWLQTKKGSEMSFLLGSISLNDPMDRRYFYAMGPDKTILGFVVFVPFLGGRGLMADVTRRKNTAPIGVMEKIIITAFDTVKNEGVKWGSLGLAPLYNVSNSEDSQKTFINSLLKYVFEHMNQFYGFKALYHYKKKYSPTNWEPRYLAYYPNIFTPQIAYSIVKAQNPKGIKDYLLVQMKKNFEFRKASDSNNSGSFFNT